MTKGNKVEVSRLLTGGLTIAVRSWSQETAATGTIKSSTSG